MKTNKPKITPDTEEPAKQAVGGNCSPVPTSAFRACLKDMNNGCPSLVSNNDEAFAIAVWNAAIRAASEQIVPSGDRINIMLLSEPELNKRVT